MTATERLRELLDERGVEWDELHDIDGDAVTRWRDSGGRYVTAFDNGTLDFFYDFFCQPTPEQAIDATLGRGTCRNAMPLLPSGMPYPDSWMCSECGGRMDGIILETGNFCPNCGMEVVDD